MDIKRPILAPLAVLLFSSLYYLSFCSYGINLWDEGGIYYGAVRYLQGQKVMEDFLGYPPGRYMIAQWSFELFGDGMLPVRRIIAILSGLLPALVFLISRKFMPLPFALVATLLMLSAPAVYYQRFYGFVILFNALAIIKFIENRANFPLIILGAALGFIFKVEPLILFIPAYCYLLWTKIDGKWRLPVMLGAALFFLGILFFSRFGNELVFRALNEYKMWGNPFPQLFAGYQGREFGLWAFLENLLFYLPFVAGALSLWIGIKTKEEKKRQMIAVLSYLQLASLSLVITRAGFDNLVRCLPLFYVTLPFLTYSLAGKIKSAPAKAATEVCAVFLLVLYLGVFNIANGFYVGSIGAIKMSNMEIQEGKLAGIKTSANEAKVILSLTDWIVGETKKNDPILLLPLNPIFYYLTERRNPTYYDWLLPGAIKSDEEEEKLIGQLKGDKPKLVIIVDIEIDEKPERSLKGYVPKVLEWILDNYRYAGRVAYFQIWKEKN